MVSAPAANGRGKPGRLRDDEEVTDDATNPGPATDRVRLRRGAHRGEYDREAVLAVLDAGFVAHVGVVTPQGPIVLPMAYGRTGEWLYLHGAVANAALRAAVGTDVCVTVTILDGLVIGRSAFHNSMNYRGVVVRGTARRVDDPDEHRLALRLVSDHVVPTWDAARPPTDAEIRRTMVIAVPLVEMSAKIRAGDPVDEPDDLDGPYWAGHVPIVARFGQPVPSGDLPAGIPTPSAVAVLAGQPLPYDVAGYDTAVTSRSQTGEVKTPSTAAAAWSTVIGPPGPLSCT